MEQEVSQSVKTRTTSASAKSTLSRNKNSIDMPVAEMKHIVSN